MKKSILGLQHFILRFDNGLQQRLLWLQKIVGMVVKDAAKTRLKIGGGCLFIKPEIGSENKNEWTAPELSEL
jgi:hypothetical protein